MQREDIERIIKERQEENKKYREDHEYRRNYWIEHTKDQEPFKLDDWCEPPIVDQDIYEEIIVPAWIRRGAIPKKDLIPGKTYLGHCRNASEAIWDGNKFTYTRYKFGTYEETIDHFEDFTEYDVFVPLKEKENEDKSSSEN